jgi:hypothetical protein
VGKRLTASLIHSHRLHEVLQEILVGIEPGYFLLTTIKPETMHVFYTTVAIAALATPETILLLIQMLLRTEGRAYQVDALVPVPIS